MNDSERKLDEMKREIEILRDQLVSKQDQVLEFLQKTCAALQTQLNAEIAAKTADVKVAVSEQVASLHRAVETLVTEKGKLADRCQVLEGEKKKLQSRVAQLESHLRSLADGCAAQLTKNVA